MQIHFLQSCVISSLVETSMGRNLEALLEIHCLIKTPKAAHVHQVGQIEPIPLFDLRKIYSSDFSAICLQIKCDRKGNGVGRTGTGRKAYLIIIIWFVCEFIMHNELLLRPMFMFSVCKTFKIITGE